MARPTSFRPEFVEQAEKLCRLGAIDTEMADFFDVAESTLYLWKTTHPEFSEAIKRGKLTADANVADRLYQRAMGYAHEETHVSNYRGAITLTPWVKHYPPETAAAIFWLKNRRPAEWRDKITSEHAGNPGNPLITRIEHVIIDPRRGTDARPSGVTRSQASTPAIQQVR